MTDPQEQLEREMYVWRCQWIGRQPDKYLEKRLHILRARAHKYGWSQVDQIEANAIEDELNDRRNPND